MIRYSIRHMSGIRLKSNQVFTPGTFPEHTYIERGDVAYEIQLRHALTVPGQVISLSGPSKSGKTVLVERVVGRDNLIAIVGANIEQPTDLWERILDELDAPSEIARSTSIGGGVSGSSEVSGDVGLPFVAKGGVKTGLAGQVTGSHSQTRMYRRNGLHQVIQEIGDSDYVVLIDDFHYMSRSVQGDVAKLIKEAVRRGLKIITASVPHRSDDVVRANPELRGRVMAINLEYWEPQHLLAIAQLGFALLGAEFTEETYLSFVQEAAGSPQLMQVICLSACLEFEVDLYDPIPSARTPTPEAIQKVFSHTAQATNFRSLVDVLDNGPRVRGTDRRIYKFTDRTKGDVYRCILKAIAENPPQLALHYDHIYERIHTICVGESPPGSSINFSRRLAERPANLLFVMRGLVG